MGCTCKQIQVNINILFGIQNFKTKLKNIPQTLLLLVRHLLLVAMHLLLVASWNQSVGC